MRSIGTGQVAAGWILGIALTVSAPSPGRAGGGASSGASPAAPSEERVQGPGQALRDEVGALFDALDRRQRVRGLERKIGRAIPGARIRGIEAYEYPILNFGEPAFDLEALRAGRLPYHVRGDFDCDGRDDSAVLLEAPKRMVVLRLATGTTIPLPEYDGDALERGLPGSHPTTAGKGHGTPDPDEPRRFRSPCDFVSVVWWMKSSYALVYEPESRSFRRFWTAD